MSLLRRSNHRHRRPGLHPGLVPGHEHLEPLEDPSRLGGLEAGVADEDLRSNADALQPVPEGHRERKRPKVVGGLDRAQDPEAPVMSAPPDPFELLPRRFPLVKLAFPDASPALQAAHRCLLRADAPSPDAGCAPAFLAGMVLLDPTA